MALNDENGGIPATMLVGPASFGNTAPYPVYMGGQQGGFGTICNTAPTMGLSRTI